MLIINFVRSLAQPLRVLLFVKDVSVEVSQNVKIHRRLNANQSVVFRESFCELHLSGSKRAL